MSFFQPSFTFTTAALRVRFGAGIRDQIGAELALLGRTRALILTTPRQQALAQEFAALCGPAARSLPEAVMHTPVDVSDRAADTARALGADVLVAVGGGSAIGLGKAIALRTGLPLVAVPTTYAGSEATPILGQTRDGKKTTLRDPAVQPRVIIYDPELITDLPAAITVSSALNAMAHAAEALYAADRNPLSSLMAIEGLRAFRDALPRVIRQPDDLTARAETLYAAWLCGTVLGQVGMALHHKLCHVLGGSFDLPHADTHAIILPHAIGYNAAAVPGLLAPVGALFGDPHPGRALHQFAQRVGAPMSLHGLGLTETDLDRAADLAMADPYPNPAPLTRAGIRALLQQAWTGQPPHG